MRSWNDLLGGLVLWTAHFFAVYIIGSILPGSGAALVLVLVATVLALAVAAWLFTRTARALREATDEFQRWVKGIALLGYALAGLAIAYQGLPALFT